VIQNLLLKDFNGIYYVILFTAILSSGCCLNL